MAGACSAPAHRSWPDFFWKKTLKKSPAFYGAFWTEKKNFQSFLFTTGLVTRPERKQRVQTLMERTQPSANWWRTVCRLGLKRRLVLMFEWLTRLPTCGFLPQNAHSLPIFKLLVTSQRDAKTCIYMHLPEKKQAKSGKKKILIRLIGRVDILFNLLGNTFFICAEFFNYRISVGGKLFFSTPVQGVDDATLNSFRYVYGWI